MNVFFILLVHEPQNMFNIYIKHCTYVDWCSFFVNLFMNKLFIHQQFYDKKNVLKILHSISLSSNDKVYLASFSSKRKEIAAIFYNSCSRVLWSDLDPWFKNGRIRIHITKKGRIRFVFGGSDTIPGPVFLAVFFPRGANLDPDKLGYATLARSGKREFGKYHWSVF